MDEWLNNRLNRLKENYKYRELRTYNLLPKDFSSNDYLGFARSEELQNLYFSKLESHQGNLSGSTGSRLISGNSSYIERLENSIARFHRAESGLMFNSGYDANIAVFSCLPTRHDTVILDELSHASMIDGSKLGHAKVLKFRHNDMEDLEKKIQKSKGNIFIGIEGIYSMDGHIAPLKMVCQLAEKYGASVIVDEAHSTGILGEQGRGLVCDVSVEKHVFARIVTFGKSLGAHGSIVLGSNTLRNYLINYARSFIYSTAPSFAHHLLVEASYEYLQQKNHQEKIVEKVNYFLSRIPDKLKGCFVPSLTQIQSLVIKGNRQTKDLAEKLQKEGFFVYPVLSPTVEEGKERTRICLHSFNTFEEIDALLQLIKINV